MKGRIVSENRGRQAAANDRSYVPLVSMAKEAAQGLAWRRRFGHGGTAVGLARARDLKNRRPLTLQTVRRMAAYFARHESDKQKIGWFKDEPGYPTKGRIAWALWGGDKGREWAERILEKVGEKYGR